MAKGLRASTRKKNNSVLSAKVFAPVTLARTERLSAKLQELAAKPRPDQVKSMDIDESVPSESLAEKNDAADVDVEMKGPTNSERKASSKAKSASRMEKRIMKKKPRNLVVFKSEIGRKKRLARMKKN